MELSLSHSVTHPAESHVHGFGLLLLDGVICNASGHTVVDRNGSQGLWVAHLLEHCSD
jgi:hypothetical protein